MVGGGTVQSIAGCKSGYQNPGVAFPVGRRKTELQEIYDLFRKELLDFCACPVVTPSWKEDMKVRGRGLGRKRLELAVDTVHQG